jgi:hypothetical protein
MFARLGIGRIPEETEPPPALQSLNLPLVEAFRRRRSQTFVAEPASGEGQDAAPLKEA